MTRETASPRALCMVVHAYYPIGEPRVQREAHAASAAGYEVHVVALRGPAEPAEDSVDGIRVHRVGMRHRRGIGFGGMVVEYVGFALAASRVVARLHQRHGFAVVHVHAPPDFLIVTALVPRLRGAKTILDIHDLSPDMFGARFGGTATGRLVAAVLRGVEVVACRFAARVVTVHEPYRSELVAHRVPPDKVTVVMNSADDALVERARRAAPAQEDGFELAYHGTITHWYGVDLLVRAVAELASELPAVRAVVLGEGDALDGATRLADELGIADRIEFSGHYVPIEEALARVSIASCGVIPNRPSKLNRFALSSKLFEYVALGVPVVVARLETLAAHFADDEVHFFEPGDAHSLAAAIRAVAADPAASATRVERARSRAREYAWTSNAERYVALLRSLDGSYSPTAARVGSSAMPP